MLPLRGLVITPKVGSRPRGAGPRRARLRLQSRRLEFPELPEPTRHGETVAEG